MTGLLILCFQYGIKIFSSLLFKGQISESFNKERDKTKSWWSMLTRQIEKIKAVKWSVRRKIISPYIRDNYKRTSIASFNFKALAIWEGGYNRCKVRCFEANLTKSTTKEDLLIALFLDNNWVFAYLFGYELTISIISLWV